LEGFAEAAYKALEDHPIGPDFAPRKLAEFILRGRMPPQTRYQVEFADPSVTVFRCPEFSIEINFWRHSTTAIHQHSFAGAFCVLSGQSIQATWSFDTVTQVSQQVRLGNLDKTNLELLRAGAVRPIYPGQRLIHSVFHLSYPTVTLVVRANSGDRGASEPPFLYLPPGVSYSPRGHNEDFEKRASVFEVLRNVSGDSISSAISLAGSGLTPDEWIYLLVRLIGNGTASRACRQLASLASEMCPGLSGYVEPAVDRLLNDRLSASLRRKVLSDTGRLLIALLLNCNELDALVLSLKKFSITDPIQFISTHALELIEAVTGPHLKATDDGEVEIIRYLLDGRSRQEALVATSAKGSRIPAQTAADIYDVLENTPFFRPLLSRRICA
jgi:hypothetical protein